MKCKNLWVGMLVMVLVFGMMVVSCDLEKDDEDDFDNRPSLFGIVQLNNTQPVVGETITATLNAGTGSGGTGIPTWEWIRGSTLISGASNNSYTTVSADIGQVIKARLSYSGNQGKLESSATNPVIGIPSTGNVSISIDTIVDTAWFAASDQNRFEVNIYLTLSDGVWNFGNDGVDYSMVRSWVIMSGTPNVNNIGIGSGQWNFGPMNTNDRQKKRLSYSITYPKSTGNISISGLTATLDITKLTQIKDYTNVTSILSAGSPTTVSSSVWVEPTQ